MSNAFHDIVIRNGTVVDGSGRPAFAADIAIRGDRIAQVGNLQGVQAAREIDASGRVVAPGFIDVHAHDDAALIDSPQMEAKLTQDVTTVVAGNCGMGGAPVRGRDVPPGVLRLLFKSNRTVAARFSEFLKKVEGAGPATNSAFLVGHTTLRMDAMGPDLNRVATSAEIAAMRDQLTECLEDGAFGLSTGLFYPEARAASTEEVIEVARPLSAYRGLYVTHLRNEGDRVVESLHEAFRIGREVASPVIVSHHKCLGPRNFGRSVETVALLERVAREQSVAWDVYPYQAGSTVLNEELVLQSGSTIITWCDPHPEVSGQRLEDIASVWGCSIQAAITRLQPAGALYFMMDKADVDRILCSTFAMIGSDGLPADKHPHPRLWGTFPRILGRCVREQKLLTLESAIYRMTGLSAERFGIVARGLIIPGNHADLCVFNAESILDSATYEQPTSAAVGIDYVLVNGLVTYDRGSLATNRAGRVLRRTDGTT